MRPGNAVGLDIGTTAVRAAEISLARRGGTTLERFGEVALPEGAVVDGEVADGAVVAQALRRLWSEQRFRTRNVVLGVANPRVIVRQVDIPRVPPQDLAAALPFQVQDLLPIPVESAVLDFHTTGDQLSPAGDPLLRGMLVAASREMVLRTVRAVEAAGLAVVSVDLTPFAVLRAAGTRSDLDVETEAVLDVGARMTTITVHSAGVPRLVRILLSGGRDITDAIAEDLGVPTSEAEEVKHGLDVAGSVDAADAATAAADAAAHSFVGEVRVSLDYYTASHPDHPLQRIVVTGGGSLMRGLAERLTAETRLPVVPAATAVPLGAGASRRDEGDLARWSVAGAAPVGLAMGGGR